MVTVEEMGAARHFVRTQFQSIPEEQRYQMLQPQLEINPKYDGHRLKSHGIKHRSNGP